MKEKIHRIIKDKNFVFMSLTNTKSLWKPETGVLARFFSAIGLPPSECIPSEIVQDAKPWTYRDITEYCIYEENKILFVFGKAVVNLIISGPAASAASDVLSEYFVFPKERKRGKK